MTGNVTERMRLNAAMSWLLAEAEAGRRATLIDAVRLGRFSTFDLAQVAFMLDTKGSK